MLTLKEKDLTSHYTRAGPHNWPRCSILAEKGFVHYMTIILIIHWVELFVAKHVS